MRCDRTWKTGVVTAFIPEPTRPNPLVRLGVAVAERMTGRAMPPARLLAWSTRAALGAGVLEATAAAPGKGISPRLLKLVRLTVSLEVNCPFCIDMNASEHRQFGITDEQVRAIRAGDHMIEGLSETENLAVAYARGMSATPANLHDDVIARVISTFTPQQVVILASTAAQVNYWARLNQGLGVPSVGFGDHCLILDTDHADTGNGHVDTDHADTGNGGSTFRVDS